MEAAGQHEGLASAMNHTQGNTEQPPTPQQFPMSRAWKPQQAPHLMKLVQFRAPAHEGSDAAQAARACAVRMVKTITGTKERIVAPAAPTAGQSWPPTPDGSVGMNGGAASVRCRMSEDHGQGIFIPREDQAEDRRRGDARSPLAAGRPCRRPENRGVTVNQGRLLHIQSGSHQ